MGRMSPVSVAIAVVLIGIMWLGPCEAITMGDLCKMLPYSDISPPNPTSSVSTGTRKTGYPGNSDTTKTCTESEAVLIITLLIVFGIFFCFVFVACCVGLCICEGLFWKKIWEYQAKSPRNQGVSKC